MNKRWYGMAGNVPKGYKDKHQKKPPVKESGGKSDRERGIASLMARKETQSCC